MRKIRIDYSFIINPIGFWAHALAPYYIDTRNYAIKKKMRKNNKGFSLVELIIVIAIMAILASAIAPALIRYINKARKADDIAFADSLGTTFQASVSANDALYEYVNYRASHERNPKYFPMAIIGYGNHIDLILMKPGGIDNDIYNEAKNEVKSIVSELIGIDVKHIPLKFFVKNDLDQWVICTDKDRNLYIFVCGRLNDQNWYIKEDRTIKGQGGTWVYAYMLWPEVDPKYNALNLPKDVLKDRP